MIWPPNFHAENVRRALMMRDFIGKPKLQAMALAFYRDHPIEWIHDWAITFDPRNEPPTPRMMPFIMFPRQVDLVRFLLSCLTDKEGGLIEKSRDMGATWVCCAFSLWLWLFRPGSIIGWGSRKEEYVDDRFDPKAIFPKLRQILQHLPSWMVPRGFDFRTHSTYMKLINPANSSAITGEAGDNIGRGGRTTIYFKDESAHYEHPESVEAALGDNTNVQIDLSSVHGSANVFYRKRMAGEVWYPDVIASRGRVRVFIMDWRDHPAKTQEWYDFRRQIASDSGLLHILAQEVDRDYSSSIDNIIIRPEWVEAAIDAHIKLGLPVTGSKISGQDIADGGGDRNALAIRHGVLLQYIEHWAGEAGDAPQIAMQPCMQFGVRDLYYDSVGVGTGFKVGVNNLKKTNTWPASIGVHPWSGADAVLDPLKPVIPNDRDSPKNEDQYHNLKAQAWFRLRTRFIKTFKAVHEGTKFDSDDLISLDSKMPRLHELKMELSQAVHKVSATGKTVVDKKPDGARSPNLADAVVICYCPLPGRNSLFNFEAH